MEEEKKESIELKKSEETTSENTKPVIELAKGEKVENKQETSTTTTTDTTTTTTSTAEQSNNVGGTTTAQYEENNKKGLCVASLVLGLVALALWCLWYISIPCGILAIIFGIFGMKSPNKGMAIAGLTTGIIGILITGIILVVLVIAGIAEGISDATDTKYNKNYNKKYDYSLFD